MPKINVTQQRDKLINDLIVGAAKQGREMNPELERRIIAMAYEKFPQAPHEAPRGFIAKVVLTKEEVIAAALALGLKIEDSADVTKVENPNCHDLTMNGDYECDSIVGDNIRRSYTRKTAGTEWNNSGDVIVYRPERKSDSAETKLNEMLKEL